MQFVDLKILIKQELGVRQSLWSLIAMAKRSTARSPRSISESLTRTFRTEHSVGDRDCTSYPPLVTGALGS